MVAPWRSVTLVDGHVIKVDLEDLPLAQSVEWKWKKNTKQSYAKFSSRSLHREIMKAKKGEVIDHKDGDTADNRRFNLRRATRSTNGQNRIGLAAHNKSGHTGVMYWDREVERGWCAFIKVMRRTTVVYRLPSLEHAIEVRRAMEVLAFGEFAPVVTQAKGTLVGKYSTLAELKAACTGPSARDRKRA